VDGGHRRGLARTDRRWRRGATGGDKQRTDVSTNEETS
jgi:hypothetical protein